MDRPLGHMLPDWQPAADPTGLTLTGNYAVLRPLDVAMDAAGLWTAFAGHDWCWDYLFEPAPADAAALHGILTAVAARQLQPCYVIRAKGDPAPLGYACFWTVVPQMGVIEIGNVNLAPALQGTRIATEAFTLMIDWAIRAGYRRVEWKCNALNAPSRRAAQRLGFSFEGIFRSHMVVKGRNRDTAWFALTDTDWNALRAAHAAWSAPENFDADGRQKRSLSEMTRPHLVQIDPTLAR